jgi:hypothetical protein
MATNRVPRRPPVEHVVISPDLPSTLQDASGAALQRLDELALLSPDWDTYGASALSTSAVEASRRLVLDTIQTCWRVAGVNGAPSFIAPIADGGVQLEWDGPTGHLEVEVTPQSSLDYLLVLDSKPDRVFEERHGISHEAVLTLVARVLGSPADG